MAGTRDMRFRGGIRARAPTFVSLHTVRVRSSVRFTPCLLAVSFRFRQLPYAVASERRILALAPRVC